MPNYLSPGVYMEEVSSGSKPIEGAGTALAAFVGFAEKGPSNEPVLVTNWEQFAQTFGGFIEGGYLAHAVYGYFLNGGGSAYVVRIGANGSIGNGSGTGGERGAELAAPAAHAELPVTGGKPLVVRAIEGGSAGNSVRVEVTEASEPGPDTFKLIIRKDDQQEVYDNVTTKRGQSNVITAVKQSKLVTIEEMRGEEAKTGTLAAPRKGAEVVLAGGTDPAPRKIKADDYVGNAADRTGFSGLEAVDDVTMVSVPDLMAAYQSGMIDDDGLKAVQLAIIAHCELMADRVAILDPPPGLRPQQLKTWRMDVAGYDSKYASLYWPWITVMDPRSGKPTFVPPSGHIAGVWARNDDTRGVYKAPANEVMRGVIELQSDLTRGEHDQLNPIGVNCIRTFPGQGIRVWGARTLSSDPEWRYLNVRRLFNYIEKSILNSTNWVVFEPNDRFLWDSVRRTIEAFLRRVWRSGALFGETPSQAYFVRCDEHNNPAENRDAGILTVDVGIAPVKPAEFVVFRLSQFSEGAELSE